MSDKIINMNEELFLKSLDNLVSKEERDNLEAALTNDASFRMRTEQFQKLREMIKQPEDSFGPFFAERVVNHLKVMKQQFDYQLIFFFKKYHLVAAGIIIALLAINILQSDQLTAESVIGLEHDVVEEALTIDLYQIINE